MNTENSPTWILFASGNFVRIELSLYDPAFDQNRPVTAYMVSDVGNDIASSASRAAETVFKIAYDKKVTLPPTVVGFDLPDLSNGSQIAGLSSGLALALALAKKIWATDADTAPIAATGEISSSGSGGLIQKISHIEAKALATLKLFHNGGTFFYPMDNDPDINPEIKKKLIQNNIKLHPVTSVTEALGIILPNIFDSHIIDKGKIETELAASATDLNPKKSSNCTIIIIMLSSLLLISAIAGWFYFNKRSKTQTTPLVLVKNQPEKKIKLEQIPQKDADKSRKPPLSHKIDIRLKGKSKLENLLAQLTNSHLKSLVTSNKLLFTDLESLTGKIKITTIKEFWNQQTNSLDSSLSATFRGKLKLKNSSRYKISCKPVTTDGSGSVHDQLTTTSILMAEKIKAKILNPTDSLQTGSSIRKNSLTTQTEKLTAKPQSASHKTVKDTTNGKNQPGKGFE